MPQSTQTPIKLIVGLGNPGAEYEETRHNAGFWFIEKLSDLYSFALKTDKKSKSIIGKFTSRTNQEVHVLMPQNYMNNSGASVQVFCQFFKIKPQEILVAHDELDHPAGIVRLKQAGGTGGHNGLRDIQNKLGTNSFNRLRIGIGHPRNTNSPQAVHNYVLAKPNLDDKNKIMESIELANAHLDIILDGNFQTAMKNLHS